MSCMVIQYGCNSVVDWKVGRRAKGGREDGSKMEVRWEKDGRRIEGGTEGKYGKEGRKY